MQFGADLGGGVPAVAPGGNEIPVLQNPLARVPVQGMVPAGAGNAYLCWGALGIHLNEHPYNPLLPALPHGGGIRRLRAIPVCRGNIFLALFRCLLLAGWRNLPLCGLLKKGIGICLQLHFFLRGGVQ